MKIEIVTDHLDANLHDVLVDHKKIGHMKRAQHGPGFFLKIDGKLWSNAPGARHSNEGAPTEYTYVKNMKIAKQRIMANV